MRQLDSVQKAPPVSEKRRGKKREARQKGTDSDLFWTTEEEIYSQTLRKLVDNFILKAAFTEFQCGAFYSE